MSDRAMTTEPRTLEETAHDVWLLCGAPEGVDEAGILVALHEAADAARQEEREALRRWIDRRRDHHGVNAIVYAEGLLTWLDARSRKDSR